MPVSPFRRVVIWGHPLHTNTFSYVYEAFARAFRHLGWEVWWLPDQPMYPPLDLDGSLVIVEGQVDRYLPRHAGATYVLHNCNWATYADVRRRCLAIQVHTDAQMEGRIGRMTEIAPFVHHEPSADSFGMLYQPWATDLLPGEINIEDAGVPRDRKTWWVGTIGEGQFGNVWQIEGFRRACQERGVEFVHHPAGIDREAARPLIRRSYIAPAIVGKWQLEVGYIPCRIFKNISYGQLGVTNSPTVQRLFGGTLVQDVDTHALFLKAEEAARLPSGIERTRALMEEVRSKHTYVNRIAAILRCLGVP